MAEMTLADAVAFYARHQSQQNVTAMTLRKAVPQATPVPRPVEQRAKPGLGDVAKLWGRYAKAADLFEAKSRTSHGADDLRKAITYRKNANTLMGYLHNQNLVKGYPIPKRGKWRGMDVSIENPAGSVRQWGNPDDGKAGFTFMLFDYGYLRGTTGADKDHVDVFMGPSPDEPMVYVVRQMKAPGFDYYDEDKCMIGFESEDSARRAYLAHYDNPRFLGKVDAFPCDAFLQAVKATKKAPAPVGGWAGLGVQSRVSDLKEILPQSLLRLMDDTDVKDPSGRQTDEMLPDLLSEARGLDLSHYTDPATRQ